MAALTRDLVATMSNTADVKDEVTETVVTVREVGMVVRQVGLVVLVAQEVMKAAAASPVVAAEVRPVAGSPGTPMLHCSHMDQIWVMACK